MIAKKSWRDPSGRDPSESEGRRSCLRCAASGADLSTVVSERLRHGMGSESTSVFRCGGGWWSHAACRLPFSCAHPTWLTYAALGCAGTLLGLTFMLSSIGCAICGAFKQSTAEHDMHKSDPDRFPPNPVVHAWEKYRKKR